MSDQEQIEAFLKAKGATKVAIGENTLGHMTSRDWASAARSTKRLNARLDPIDERHVVVDHLGRQHIQNGLGEWLN